MPWLCWDSGVVIMLPTFTFYTSGVYGLLPCCGKFLRLYNRVDILRVTVAIVNLGSNSNLPVCSLIDETVSLRART